MDVTQVSVTNRFSASYSNNPLDRITKIVHQRADETILTRQEYTYDKANQLDDTIDDENQSDYSYDLIGQLDSVNRTIGSNETYHYDDAGNRLRTSNQPSDNIIEIANRIISDGVFNFSYDNEGNLTNKTTISSGEQWNYIFDHRNRLISAKFSSINGNVLKEITFEYDIHDRRIEKASLSNTIRYFYNGHQIWRSIDSFDHEELFLSSETDNWLAKCEGTSCHWYVEDRIGSVIQILNSDSELISEFSYFSFGVFRDDSGLGGSTNIGFTGREYDSNTELYYFRARYFSAGTGKFISEDPVTYSAGDFNLTRYVFNAPTQYTDRFGLAVDYASTTNANTGKVVGTHLFYSGGRAALLKAQELAAKHGGLLLLQATPIGILFSRITTSLTQAQQLPYWQYASARFAASSQTAVVVLNQASLKANSVWLTVEKPILKALEIKIIEIYVK